MPKAFWAFHTVLIHSKWFVRFVKEMWLKRSANAKLESWCMWAGKGGPEGSGKKGKRIKIRKEGLEGRWNMRESKWGIVWNLKLCILPTGRFFLTFPKLFVFSHFFFPWLIYFMPRGLFVFPGLFVVHLDLGTLINQFLWRLWSKNERWVGFWANLNWCTSDEVKFSHVKFHCFSTCINNEHYSPSVCQKKVLSAPSENIILHLIHIPINVCILQFWKSKHGNVLC